MIVITDFNKDTWEQRGALWLAWAHNAGEKAVILDYGIPDLQGIEKEVLVLEGRKSSPCHLFNVVTTITQDGPDAGLWGYSRAGRQLPVLGDLSFRNKLRASTKVLDLASIMTPIVNFKNRAQFGELLKREVIRTGEPYSSEFLVGPTNIWDFFYGFLDYVLSSGFMEPYQADDLAINLFALMYQGYVGPLHEEDNSAAQPLSSTGN